MIIYSLLFIIVLIFAYETIRNIFKLREEYFSNAHDHFVSNPLPKDPLKADISKTIAINCKAYPSNINKVMTYIETNSDDLDTVYSARFAPLEYDPTRKYYYRRDILIPEGIRRSQDDNKQIAKVQAMYDAETDPDKKQILQDELDLFKWRNNILSSINKETKLNRTMRDITSDYFPAELGMQRVWQEPHSHIPDYSNSLNYGYKAYSSKDIYKNPLDNCPAYGK
jgi:hypothetical protein